MRIYAHCRRREPPTHGLNSGGAVACRKQRTSQPHALTVKRERLCNLRTKTQKARRIEDRASKSMRERRVVFVGAEERDLPPALRRRNWKLDF